MSHGEFTLITPEEAAKLKGDTVEHYSNLLAKYRDKKCDCGEAIWMLAGCDMCFSCTTGEADCSDDYELIEF